MTIAKWRKLEFYTKASPAVILKALALLKAKGLYIDGVKAEITEAEHER